MWYSPASDSAAAPSPERPDLSPVKIALKKPAVSPWNMAKIFSRMA